MKRGKKRESLVPKPSSFLLFSSRLFCFSFVVVSAQPLRRVCLGVLKAPDSQGIASVSAPSLTAGLTGHRREDLSGDTHYHMLLPE